jgi:hypothetical protein
MRVDGVLCALSILCILFTVLARSTRPRIEPQPPSTPSTLGLAHVVHTTVVNGSRYYLVILKVDHRGPRRSIYRQDYTSVQSRNYGNHMLPPSLVQAVGDLSIQTMGRSLAIYTSGALAAPWPRRRPEIPKCHRPTLL